MSEPTIKDVADKLDRILELITKLIDPMTKTLDEAEKSTREINRSTLSRYIVLGGMALTVIVMCGAMGYVLWEMRDVVKKLEEQHLKVGVTEVQVDTLVDLAKKNASTPEIRKKLEKITRIKDDPSPEQVKMVIKAASRKPSSSIQIKVDKDKNLSKKPLEKAASSEKEDEDDTD